MQFVFDKRGPVYYKQLACGSSGSPDGPGHQEQSDASPAQDPEDEGYGL